jgi:chloride intracellular channel protein 2
VILSDVDEIAEYLDRLYPNSPLVDENSEAKRVCLNVFSKFSFFIRDVSSKSTSLEHELEKIDAYLRAHTNEQSKFLNGNTMSLLDCSLLPKLQHIRVAGENIKKFKIPSRFKSLWKYIENAYKTDAFQKSCPPDREIIWNWSKTFLTHKDLLQIMQEAPHKTLTIPDEISY